MANSPFDPEFESAARFLPRGIARSWNLPLLRMLGALTGRGPDPENVEIEDTRRGPQYASIGLTIERGRNPAGGAVAPRWRLICSGSPKQDDALCRQIADELGAIVVAPVYRLSPKHAFPAALDDAYAALALARETLDGVDAKSARRRGGERGQRGLAAQLALHARDRGEIQLGGADPPLPDARRSDGPCGRTSMRAHSGSGTIVRIGSAGRPISATRPARPKPARSPPPRGTRISAGLPPAWIGVGGLDLFCDEDVAYGERLRAAGVPCETIVIDGVFHGFDGIVPDSAATKRLRESMFAEMRKLLAAP